MTEATLRTAVYNCVNAVTNIGLVYDYERFVVDWSAYLDLFKTTVSSTVQIRGWTIGLQKIDAEQTVIKHRTWREYTYKIRGYMGLDDSAATEKTAAALAETVINALDDDTTIHAQTAHVGPASLTVFEPRTFGGVVCHYIEITQAVGEARISSA